MTAVILAAGRGGRLRGVAGGRPKCLMRLGDRTLLERQIRALRGKGIDRIVVVAGYRTTDVEWAAGPAVEIVRNDLYTLTNSLYSLWLARAALTGDCLILNGDVLFADRLLEDLLTARYEDALLVSARGDDEYSDEEMKVQIRAGRIVDIAKTLATPEADGENVGIAKFGAEGASVLRGEVERLLTAGGATLWLPVAFAAFCRRRPLHAVDTRGLPWIEIDFPEDYWRARGAVLPAIEAIERVPHNGSASRRAHHHV